ncbi:transglycosylase SLT domain-containing protein [Ectobacillus ponti]|uniref:Transglycosylase SLT domain-containing protein n=1 Tax=Ectobacillus ponti TaxID=2961894 RepID=A0AA42BQN3_9BACI|nr:transglycosylase SLT domain-containing protein [Ectobacillus ponti]MCP8968634.1 transglycosylase SLT domain-containing protein [Ectobacillus ponti]
MKKVFLALCMLTVFTAGAYFMIRQVIFPLKYEAFIEKYAREYHVPPHLAAGIIRLESGFQSEKSGGLMNLSDRTAARIAKEMGMKYFDPSLLTHPETNIKLGMWYLGRIYNRHNFVAALEQWNARNGRKLTEQELDRYVREAASGRSYYQLIHGSRLQQ